MGSIKAIVFWPQLLAHQPPATQNQLIVAVDTAAQMFVSTYKTKS
ncbi:TetR/AcrR family transcriptional regulator C-terminal domain-containing protein [Vibrio sinaloensis]